MNLPSLLSADIETTVLVAVWSDPIIFQGYFKLSLHEPIQEFFIYFRCCNEEYSQEDFLNEEFFPNQFQSLRAMESRRRGRVVPGSLRAGCFSAGKI